MALTRMYSRASARSTAELDRRPLMLFVLTTMYSGRTIPKTEVRLVRHTKAVRRVVRAALARPTTSSILPFIRFGTGGRWRPWILISIMSVGARRGRLPVRVFSESLEQLGKVRGRIRSRGRFV